MDMNSKRQKAKGKRQKGLSGNLFLFLLFFEVNLSFLFTFWQTFLFKNPLLKFYTIRISSDPNFGFSNSLISNSFDLVRTAALILSLITFYSPFLEYIFRIFLISYLYIF
ncbi:MAG: hypothetical protein A2163_02225 [Actinobacteria bacterium RBG_13_35_12]|nr:MAG: hypothetical protein A2163_02225 [Actinobacteria bacterium RBG_13_35_12]